MNILYVLQQSIYNREGKWITADSNINMMTGILRELVDSTNHEFYILIGKLSDFADIKDFKEIFDHKRVHFVEYNFPVNAFLNRQHFNIVEFDEMYSKLPHIDMIWNNITELTRNIKTYLYIKKHKAKIITCCYWLDCPTINQSKVDKSISYDWRQFDGYECSDICAFTCQSTYDAFIDNAYNKFNGRFVDNIVSKSTIWDFGYSQKELDNYTPTAKTTKEKVTIAFLNRLSDINYTHHMEFINAVNGLATKRNDFEVVIANPTQKVSWQWLEDNVKNLRVITREGFKRQEYINFLHECDITVHLFTEELYGGCAHREALHCGNIVVTPNLYEYAIIQGKDYPMYVKNDFSDLAHKLDLAIEMKKLRYTDSPEYKMIQHRNMRSSFEIVSHIVKTDLDALADTMK